MKLSGYPYVSMTDCNSVRKFTISNTRPNFNGSGIERITCDDGSLSSDFYMFKGRLKRFNHSSVKGDDVESLKRSFARLRDLINCNYVSPERTLFITLTYRVSPSLEKLSRDMRRFHASVGDIAPVRYIYTVEQQSRGAWHVHTLLFFDGDAPYLSSDFMRSHWEFNDRVSNVPSFRGFWQIDRFDSEQAVRNIGAYVCAYLTDSVSDHGRAKNSRLMNYASNIHLYRCSRNIERPVKYDDVPYSVYEGYKADNMDNLIYTKRIEHERDSYTYEHFKA